MFKLDEMLTTVKDVFADEMDEGYIDSKDDIIDFAIEEADMCLEQMDNEDKLNLLIEIDKDGYKLEHFQLAHESTGKTLQDVITSAVGLHLSSRILQVAKEVWDESN